MSEYVLGVFAICLAGGVASMLSYGSGKAEIIVVGIVSLYVILSPVAAEALSFNLTDYLQSIEDSAGKVESEYSTVIEDAFAEGISRAIAEKFNLNTEDIRVKLSGFDSETMRAEKIKVTLSGVAAFSDYKAVDSYIDGLNLGECDVEIEIG